MSAIMIPNTANLEKFKTLQVNIVSPETEVQARSYLTDVSLALRQLENDIKILKRPHLDAIKDIETAANEWKLLLVGRTQTLNAAIVDYNKKVAAAVEKANAKTLVKYEGKVANSEARAIAAGKPIPVVLPPQLAAAPAKSVQVEGIKQTTVKTKSWRLAGGSQRDPDDMTADEAHAYGIPLKYFKLDTGAIGKVIRAGGEIPGIEMYYKETISVRS